MKKTKLEKGITLIALIITIVVLLILAVVTIGAIQESKIISHSKNATNKYTIAKEKEELELAIMEATMAGKGRFSYSLLDSNLPEEFTGSNGRYTSPSGIEFAVNGEGNIDIVINGEESGEDTIPPTGDEISKLEKYFFGDSLTGRPLSEIFIQDSLLFKDEETTIADASESIVYSDMGGIENGEKAFIIFRYKNEFYKFVFNTSSEYTDANYGVIKLEVDTSNFTILEKYMFGEHGQGRYVESVYNIDDEVFIDNPELIPDASTSLTVVATAREKVYFTYKDELYKVSINESKYIMDVNYGVIKIDKLEEDSRVGKIIEYDERLWTILYDDTVNGLQMISNETYGTVRLNDKWIENEEEFTIADFDKNNTLDDGEKKLYTYNTAIEILNLSCKELVLENNNIIDVRSVGSNPINKNNENNIRYTSEKLKGFMNGVVDGKAKSTDQNYELDFERMIQLGIFNVGTEYWLASRVIIDDYYTYINFCVRTCIGNYVSYSHPCGVSESIITSQGAGSDNYLRPVVKLKQDVVFSGSGTDADPYTF